MIPPMAKGEGSNAETQAPAAVLSCLPGGPPQVLRHRADFLKAASARRQGMPGFLLQARARGDDSALIRVGYTCSKKLGNAVARNRAKRRLREVARVLLPRLGQPGWDYVLVGRPNATADRSFTLLLDDLQAALIKIHASSEGARK
ncbi:ribonuclease P protein component [Pseudorhodobacter sp.]|uniref:ribonuclease P protein component n=1 Tax=Pseudorhodobacter sp. TaxID=1934400 RepID=UPI00264A4230|nr:ribonuclease P protein component [Pseudorhodobacter sp.]MDN5788214.1 ribonuclease P protein component [Pseudorhodobacter sp.]